MVSLEYIAFEHNNAAAELVKLAYDTPPLAFVHSYGCQQNVNDGERIKGVLTAEDTVSRIYINFCNPWSKNASSNKHRLTYPRQLIQYRDFLKDGGEIYFKTDDDDLFRDSLTYFPASGYDIIWQTYDLHENEPEWNIRTEHEGMFTEMGIKIKALIARKKAGDDSVTWVEPKVLKKLAAQAEAEASAKAEGEGNV